MTVRIIGFKTEYRGTRAIDMVEIAPNDASFDKCRTWHRVKDLTPPDTLDESKRNADTYVAMTARWSVIGPAYEAWKRNEDIPEEGTPLAAWSALSPEQAAHLRGLGIRTVEDVRDMQESLFSRVPFPNVRQLPKLAGDYLDSRGKVEAAEEAAKMRDQVAALTAQLEALTAARAEEPKRGPGRPRKVEEPA